ncbi:putative pyridoxal phosphate-dependent aminotransferase EpsN [Fusobacterium necrophorum]|nr:LegC family aminotransferase [Fusobacterium necrophorum]MBR8734798.1 putative pyridoxal phosphate-dependent aminotransferase EpsN [Fusobacterium necrophorum]MBR8790964.1 putative pyridoxal phosphate-dependent aminotransferase EpsN [Fusobacterium necrophorum]
MKNINLSVPNLSLDIVDSLRECIETGWVSTGGKFIPEFEGKMAKYLHAKDTVGVQSGTAALHIALRILGVEHNDEVFAPTLTFIAAVNPIIYQGASPIFMDCDDTLCMDPIKLEKFCREECNFIEGKLINKKTQKHIKAIVIVHIFGNLANMEKIMDIAIQYNLKVLEDATEALGSYYTEGRYQGKFAGTIGDFGAYSFNANKIITTGGGGMLVSNSNFMLEKARFLSTQAKTDPLYFIHDEVGYNYRMLNLQAALGSSQIDHLEEFIATKERNYNHYLKGIEEINGLEILSFVDYGRTNHWFYSLIIDKEKYGVGRDELLQNLVEVGIQTRPIWGLIHEQKSHEKYQAYQIEKAKYYYERVLNLPCSSNLTKEEVNVVLARLKELKK